MKLWPLIPRLLSILAVLLAPTVLPPSAMAMGSHPTTATAEMASMSQSMPGCPSKKTAVQDCSKSCPLAVLCMASFFADSLPMTALIPAMFALTVKAPGDDLWRDRLTDPPPPRPPRA